MIFVRTYPAPPIDEAQVLRYARASAEDAAVVRLLRECAKEAENACCFRVCYRTLDVKLVGDTCDFGAFCATSHALAAHLAGHEKALLFAASIGLGFDRLLAKYSRLSPAKALLLQALGTERAETLCDLFCADAAREYRLACAARFSPGYGDLPLATQKDVFAALDCERKIGLTLNDSLIMSPAKSVTAFVGL